MPNGVGSSGTGDYIFCAWDSLPSLGDRTGYWLYGSPLHTRSRKHTCFFLFICCHSCYTDSFLKAGSAFCLPGCSVRVWPVISLATWMAVWIVGGGLWQSLVSPPAPRHTLTLVRETYFFTQSSSFPRNQYGPEKKVNQGYNFEVSTIIVWWDLLLFLFLQMRKPMWVSEALLCSSSRGGRVWGQWCWGCPRPGGGGQP